MSDLSNTYGTTGARTSQGVISAVFNDAQDAGTPLDVLGPPVDLEHGGRGTDGGTR